MSERAILNKKLIVNIDQPSDLRRITRLQSAFSQGMPELKIGQGLVFMPDLDKYHRVARLLSSTILDMRHSGNPDLMAQLVETAKCKGFGATTIAPQVGRLGLVNAAKRQDGIRIIPVIFHDTAASDIKDIQEANEDLDPDDQITQVLCEAIDISTARQLGISVIASGIRLPGQPRDDHLTVLTPAQAISAGADKVSVGRILTAADNPEEVYARILDNIATIQ